MRALFASAFSCFVLALVPPTARAGGGDCVSLSPQAEAIVIGARNGPKSLLLHDGDAYWRVDFFSLRAREFPETVPQRIRVTSQKRPRTLCTNARTIVRASNGWVYPASRVASITADIYQRHAQSARMLALD
ncbi:MAG: hypothetical protein QM769_01985 [Pseudoxanthomonas sp.]